MIEQKSAQYGFSKSEFTDEKLDLTEDIVGGCSGRPEIEELEEPEEEVSEDITKEVPILLEDDDDINEEVIPIMEAVHEHFFVLGAHGNCKACEKPLVGGIRSFCNVECLREYKQSLINDDFED